MFENWRNTAAGTVFFALGVWSGMSAANDLADPTRPPDYRKPVVTRSAPSLPAMELTSIMISPERRVAIIDGHSLRQGATHRGLRIVAIESDRVRLEGAAGNVTLKLLPTAVKRAVRKVSR